MSSSAKAFASVTADASEIESAEVLESVHVRPAPALLPYVAWYSGYRQEGCAPGLHRGLPSPYLTLIFTLDDPLTMAAHADPRQPPGDFDTLLGGMHARPVLISHPGRQSGIQLALHPLGARTFLGLPAGEIAGIDLPAEDVLGPVALEAYERLRFATSWDQRFRVLDALLTARIEPRTGMRDEVAFVWQQLLATGGRASVAELARSVGWSTRYLGSRFRSEIGLAPKAAARVIRFDRVRRALPRIAASGTPLADAAVTFGYYDQAHLAREFRELAGCPPTTWLAEEVQAEFRIVQGEAGEPVAGSIP